MIPLEQQIRELLVFYEWDVDTGDQLSKRIVALVNEQVAGAFEAAARTICVTCDSGIALSDGKNKMHLGGLHCYAWSIRALTPADAASALAERERAARLDEAKWWRYLVQMREESYFAIEGDKRIAELSRLPASSLEGLPDVARDRSGE